MPLGLLVMSLHDQTHWSLSDSTKLGGLPPSVENKPNINVAKPPNNPGLRVRTVGHLNGAEPPQLV